MRSLAPVTSFSMRASDAYTTGASASGMVAGSKPAHRAATVFSHDFTSPSLTSPSNMCSMVAGHQTACNLFGSTSNEDDHPVGSDPVGRRQWPEPPTLPVEAALDRRVERGGRS